MRSLTTIRLDSNIITNFPSTFIYNIPTLTQLYFKDNQISKVPLNAFRNVSKLQTIDFSSNLFGSFELWTLAVQGSVDFSNNQITKITNDGSYALTNPAENNRVNLDQNGPMNLTDAIYEMYNACEEVRVILRDDNPRKAPLFTIALAQIRFGSTQLFCSCDQFYIFIMLDANYAAGPQNIVPIYNTICAEGKGTFRYNTCANNTDTLNSTVDFSKVWPRLCKIDDSEAGTTTPQGILSPPANVSVRYRIQVLEPIHLHKLFASV